MLPEILSLDAGGTLIFPYPSVGTVYREVLLSHGVDIAEATLNQRFRKTFPRAHERSSVKAAPYSPEFWRWIVYQVIQPEAGEAAVREAVFQEAYERFGRGDCWRLAEGLCPVLEHLQNQGQRLVVFSNNDARLETVLQDLGVASLFESVFVSTRLGQIKPHLEAFRAVEAALSLEPENFLHIGDSVENDGWGPRRAGWNSILSPGCLDPRGAIPSLDTWRALSMMNLETPRGGE